MGDLVYCSRCGVPCEWSEVWDGEDEGFTLLCEHCFEELTKDKK